MTYILLHCITNTKTTITLC